MVAWRCPMTVDDQMQLKKETLFFGHKMRWKKLKNIVTAGKISGRCGPGRRENEWWMTWDSGMKEYHWELGYTVFIIISFNEFNVCLLMSCRKLYYLYYYPTPTFSTVVCSIFLLFHIVYIIYFKTLYILRHILRHT